MHACRALAAFLLWSVGLQALLALHQLVTRRKLQLDRLGVDGLILSTNNTGRCMDVTCAALQYFEHVLAAVSGSPNPMMLVTFSQHGSGMSGTQRYSCSK